jgi:hypothetical protein
VAARLGSFTVTVLVLLPDDRGFADQIRNGWALDTRPFRGPARRGVEVTLASQEPSPAFLAAKESNPVFEPQNPLRAERVDLPPAGRAWLSRELRPCREHLSRLLRGIDIGSRTR